MTKRLFLVAGFVFIASSLFFSPAFAAYTWVDDDGVFHIADYPKPGKRAEPEESTSKTSAPASVPAPSAAPEVKQSPIQTAPSAQLAPQRTVTKATATVLSSAGTPTIRPAALVSQPAPTQNGHAAMATAVTVSRLTTTAPLPARQEEPRTELPVPEESQQMPAAGVMAIVMAFLTIFLAVIVGIYVYFSLCLFLIAKKLNVSAPWTAWVPIVNIWTLLQAAGKPCWWVLLFFIPLVGLVVTVNVWMCVTENLGRNKWLGLLLLVPIVGLIYLGVLAFSKQEQLAYSHG